MLIRVLKLLGIALASISIFIAGTIWWAARQDKPAAQQAPAALPDRPVAQPVLRTHNYDVQDGAQYGYTAALSDDQRQAGQVANNVMMFLYAGERGGKHQMHLHKGKLVNAFECSLPCDVIKVMTVMDMEGMRDSVNVEYIRAAPNSVAALALDDAINGRLKPYEQHREGARWEVWVNEANGFHGKYLGKVKPEAK